MRYAIQGRNILIVVVIQANTNYSLSTTLHLTRNSTPHLHALLSKLRTRSLKISLVIFSKTSKIRYKRSYTDKRVSWTKLCAGKETQ